MPHPGPDQPAKKQSKWSQEEDALIIELRGSGMKWEDISKKLPGRSAISCRLHYQNYLERRSEWSEDRKDKLAQLYERFKADMWAKVAEELAVPWRAAEAMHWQLGEQDMARRAGVVPFSLAAVNAEANAAGRRNSPSRAQLAGVQSHLQPHSQPAPPPQTQHQSQAQTKSKLQQHVAIPRDIHSPSPRPIFSRTPQSPPERRTRSWTAERPDTTLVTPHHLTPEQSNVSYAPLATLAPIHSQAQPAIRRHLPSIAELTTGVAPYAGSSSAPSPGVGLDQTKGSGAYHAGGLGGYFPVGAGHSTTEPQRAKRPANPEDDHGEVSVKRRA